MNTDEVEEKTRRIVARHAAHASDNCHYTSLLFIIGTQTSRNLGKKKSINAVFRLVNQQIKKWSTAEDCQFQRKLQKNWFLIWWSLRCRFPKWHLAVQLATGWAHLSRQMRISRILIRNAQESIIDWLPTHKSPQTVEWTMWFTINWVINLCDDDRSDANPIYLQLQSEEGKSSVRWRESLRENLDLLIGRRRARSKYSNVCGPILMRSIALRGDPETHSHRFSHRNKHRYCRNLNEIQYVQIVGNHINHLWKTTHFINNG